MLCVGLAVLVATGPAAVATRRPAALDRAGPAHDHQHAADTADTAAGRSRASAADLAVRLQALLGQHSILAADLMRSRIRGDDSFVQAANAALGENTEAMTDLVGQLFGPATGRRFGPMWSQHVVSLVTYAAAVADQDAGALTRARRELVEYEEQLADFFAGGSHGRLSRPAARAAILMHVDHLTRQADAYAAGDHATADRLYRQSYQHTYDLGLTLAEALLPAADRATLRQPIWRLRSQLGKLLAEHAALVEDVTRAAETGGPDFDAAAEMINGNTRDVAAAVDTLFGAAAARRFQALWASHVEQIVAYAGATAAGRNDRKERARASLRDFERGLAAVLAPATGGRMTPAALSAALTEHDRMLLRHADLYAAKDYQGAQEVAGRTYQHMFDLARRLADGFGAEVASRLPRGGPETGQGGLAGPR
ncbi:hypothetical protein GCM10020358_12970 [Amorphoplanes nipponensis]|uniref:Uncharacterized protein n=2 Tax=Actinoplanes nipponensis TaxID=135950 RepID=A0A919MQJ0_9ACTN|nr:hypothetical protein [Actinoplanes nipponensis]GIE50598.1 hypothetical protein Ani05nite_41320 [Actinoplanes nipponensis]